MKFKVIDGTPDGPRGKFFEMFEWPSVDRPQGVSSVGTSPIRGFTDRDLVVTLTREPTVAEARSLVQHLRAWKP